jgi:hypothetical protein
MRPEVRSLVRGAHPAAHPIPSVTAVDVARRGRRPRAIAPRKPQERHLQAPVLRSDRNHAAEVDRTDWTGLPVEVVVEWGHVLDLSFETSHPNRRSTDRVALPPRGAL